jgi:hypothetical protein
MKAQTRQWFYLISGVLGSIVPILIATGVLEKEQAGNWLNLLAVLGSLLGAGAATTAGVVVKKQRDEGLVGDSAEEILINHMDKVIRNADDANAALDRVKVAAGQALSLDAPAPTVGSLADAVLV